MKISPARSIVVTGLAFARIRPRRRKSIIVNEFERSGMEWYAKTLRAWQLAILRFAVTLDNADRLAVLMIAGEIDRLDPRQEGDPDFSRDTAAERTASAALRQYLARIDDDRLKRVFAAAIEADQPTVSPVSKPVKRGNDLWKGLSSRGNH